MVIVVVVVNENSSPSWPYVMVVWRRSSKVPRKVGLRLVDISKLGRRKSESRGFLSTGSRPSCTLHLQKRIRYPRVVLRKWYVHGTTDYGYTFR